MVNLTYGEKSLVGIPRRRKGNKLDREVLNIGQDVFGDN